MQPPAPGALPPVGDERTLYVVDLSGYLFRAYHALPELTTSRGEPSHAVLGVTTMLLKLMREQQPTMLAVAMDSRTKSFRHALYEGYKANRPAAPPDLKVQLARVREIVDAYRIAVLQQDGFEADDVIATVVARARREGLHVVIVSADKDLLQLVGEDVVMFDTMRERVYGPAETAQKMGVRPEQVRDYLALVGDSSDNIPGVHSVGPKTAGKLLQQYGDLEGVYAHLEEITRKSLRDKLESQREQAELSRRLVSLRDDLEVSFEWPALQLHAPDEARLRELFGELEFSRLLAELPDAPPAPSVDTPAAAPPRLVTTSAELDELCRELRAAGRFSQYTVLGGARAVRAEVVGVAYAWDEQAAYVPLAHRYLGAPAQLNAHALAGAMASLAADETLLKSCADAKRELIAHARLGMPLGGVGFDTMLASYLLQPERPLHTLRDVVRTYLGRELPAQDALVPAKRGIESPAELAVETAGQYAADMARAISDCAPVLRGRIHQIECDALLNDMELPLTYVLADMELTGIRIDADHLASLATRVRARLADIEARCRQLAGREFNVASPRQLETILFEDLGLPVIKRTKTARSTDADVLEELAIHHELPAAIVEHRALAKLLNTYIDALPKEIDPATGRIHTDFRQAVATTGRLSSSEPNLQNIPIRTELGRSIRDAFVAREGWRILSSDYSQIELRILAHLSGDEELLDAFQRRQDIHVRTARALFGVDEADVTREMRARAKTVNFAVIYGQTQFALARNLRIERSEASRYIKAFFEQYAGVKRYMDEIVERAKEEGFVRTLCGRRRALPDLHSKNRVKRQQAERMARNTPIQGSAADIVKLAMVAVHAAFAEQGLEGKMLLSVHDELVFGVPEAEEQRTALLVREKMEQAMKLDVPLVVEQGVGRTWGAAH